MFSREESKKLRQEFWTSFGKSFPRKWLLYNTQVKGLVLKFSFTLKSAIVSMDIESRDLNKRMELWEKLLSLEQLLKSSYSPEAIFAESYFLENNKEISRIYVEKKKVSIHDKNSWRETMEFFYCEMDKLENFYNDYKDYLSN